ncbi:hypothetical protein TNIN_269171, partial [Trichonephila inaurata madagascariensis]
QNQQQNQQKNNPEATNAKDGQGKQNDHSWTLND